MATIPIRPESVSQDLLLDYIRKRNRRRRAEKVENEAAERILAMMAVGAVVEPGIHYAEIKSQHCGARIVRKLKVG